MFLETFYPDERISSAYDIDYEGLYAAGYRGLIYDIDNTLVPHGAPADERAIRLFRRLRAIGFSCCLLSNNQAERVEMFNRGVHAYFIENAHKPARGSYLRAMERMGTTRENTMVIGDQLFTDIWGAKRAGIPNILVAPIHPKEEIQIVLKRRLEWIVLFFYERRAAREKAK